MEFQRARRPEGPQDWEAQRAVITDLYVTKGLELEDLMNLMEDEQFFKATKKQYKTHFTKWDLRKNIKPSEYSAMIKKRKEREEEGKDSAFRLRGALVDDSKIIRYEKKTKTGDEHEIAEAGTPEDLSCFTPSPFASSPNAPSPDLRHFQSPNLLTHSIVSPSEQTHLVPSPRLFSPEPLNHDELLEWFRLARAVLSPSQHRRFVTLAVDFENLIYEDIFKNVTFQCMGDFESGTLNFSLGLNGSNISSFFTLLSRLAEYTHMQQVVGSRTWRSALLHFLLSLEPYGSFSKAFVSLRRPTPTHSETRIFRLKPSAPPIYEAVNARKCVDLVYSITFHLEQKHKPGGRRSESFESIRSLDSFLSDPVVDWKELLYGYNQ